MHKVIRLISSIIVFCSINVSNSFAQEKDSLTQNDYNFQSRKSIVHPSMPGEYVAVTTFKLSTPLYPKHKYKVNFWLDSNIPVNWNSGRRMYPVMLFPSNFPNKLIRTTISKIVRYQGMMPRFAVGADAHFHGDKNFSFIVEPDTIYNYLTIGLEDNRFSTPRFDIGSGVNTTSVFIRLLEEKQDRTDDIIPEKIAGRTLTHKGKELILTDSLLTLQIYDHKKIDGDIVSIYLNKKLVVEKEVLTKKKKAFEFKIEKSQNIIVLHAENLGNEPPNTVAIIIKTKNEQYEEVLSSNLHQSEYFKLILNKI